MIDHRVGRPPRRPRHPALVCPDGRPRTLVVTGLTRDGTFLIEDGAVTRPVQNFRFNESPLAMLNNILAMGPARRAQLGDLDEAFSVPPLVVKNFTFSSISPAV
jgi:predicted Zn-dependent protease